MADENKEGVVRPEVARQEGEAPAAPASPGTMLENISARTGVRALQRRLVQRRRQQEAVDAGSEVQAAPAAAPARDAGAIHEAAERGVAGAGEALPFVDVIQPLFGGHDVGGARAYVGGAASEASERIGAVAYTSGDRVAFREAPDLHTAAHEAAHVVQQRAGVQLKGGVGEVGDPYERQADAVADRVVSGQSAADLLAGGAGGATAGGAVQRVADQCIAEDASDGQLSAMGPTAASFASAGTGPATANVATAGTGPAAAGVTVDQVTISNNGTGVSQHAISVLKEIVAAIGETSATITSGRRTPAEQAAAMYTNLENTSVAAQKALYGNAGDKVIDVYVAAKAAGKAAAVIKQEMTDKINALGPSHVSRHCSNDDVIDVAPSSIGNDDLFQSKAQAHPKVTKYLGPKTTPADPAHHLEIKA